MKNEVTDYRLIVNETVYGLETAVKEAMAEDWVPSGTIIVSPQGIVQAMVKFDAAV